MDIKEIIEENVMAYCGNSHPELGKAVLRSFREYTGASVHFQHTDIDVYTDLECGNKPGNSDKIAGKTIVYFQSIYTKEFKEEAMDSLYTFKEEYKADYIIMVAPFLMFRRQDHPEKANEVFRLRRIIKELADSGVNELIVVTPHSKQMGIVCKELNIKFTEVDMSSIFAEKISNYLINGVDDTVCVDSPDEGSAERAIKIAQALKCSVCLNIKRRGQDNGVELIELSQVEIDKIISDIQKKYKFKNIFYATPEAIVGKTIIMIDDEVSTGETANKNAAKMIQYGAKEVYFAVVHPVLTPGWKGKLFSGRPFRKVIMANTIPRGYDKRTGGKIFDVDCSDKLGSALYRQTMFYLQEKFDAK